MFSAGLFVALGLTFIWFKLDWKWRLILNSNPVKIDIIVFIVLYALHAGTYTGGMAATIGALMCSGMLSLARWAYGYNVKDGKVKVYVPGKMTIKGVNA
jgi:hypothetical protein